MREEAGQWEGWIRWVNEEILALIHAQLDESAFEDAWAEGKELTVGGAIELALESAPAA